jgi:hypothetical protein
MYDICDPTYWDLPKYEPEEHGYIHVDSLPDLEHIKLMIHEAIEAMYKTGDIADLEGALDEIAWQFDIKLPVSPVLLQKKEDEKETRTKTMLAGWVEFSKQHYKNY